jgi:t-SNARE complex subunit (syntaxin)
MTPPPNVPNYLVQAILCTLFCCLPAGIVAIVYAAQVNSKLAVGDVRGAMESSRNAKTWSWVSFGVGAAVIVIYVVIAFAAASSNAN